MNFDQWREAYSPHGMMNEAMARSAFDDSKKIIIDEISAMLRRGGADLPCNENMNGVETGMSIALLIVEELAK